jgi:hypothetical protein
MRHLLASRASEQEMPEVPRQYELNEAQAEALLDEGVVELCELRSADDIAVYHIAGEFAATFADADLMWGEVEDCACRAAAVVRGDGANLPVVKTS